MKHAKKTDKRKKQKKVINVLLLLLFVALFALGATLYRDYQARPGFLEKIWIADRGADYINVAWERPRNVYRYVIKYNDKTISVSGMRSEMRLTGLAEDTEYSISVRADSKKREGFDTLTETTRTKKIQNIAGEESQMKFANTLVDLKLNAETDLTILSENKNMKIMGDKVMFTKPGDYVVTVKTAESEDYVAAIKKIYVNVLDSVNVDAPGASPHIFYKLNKKNCELVTKISGAEGADIPQSFTYVDGKYVVLYSSKGDKIQRIISFGDEKTVTKPKVNLGHCNGFTVADDRYYEVKSLGPGCVSFDKKFSDYKTFNLPYDASGIAYDEKSDMFFVSQYYNNTTYDRDFKVVNSFARISRNKKQYTQDCGAYRGIMMHCVSGENYIGTNYIDFYDMLHQKYLGSIECDMGEVESLIINDEGYMEILCNNKGAEDGIWKTPINMKMLID